jgi:DNA-binding transcriptional MerR regulator
MKKYFSIRYYIEKEIIKPYRTKGGHYRFDKSMAKEDIKNQT